MDLKGSVVKGVMIVAHKILDEKHQYEVEDVAGEKMFARRGDMLMQINGVDLWSLLPEELAQMLAQGNPMLTVHKESKMRALNEPPLGNEETLHPVSKEYTILCFSMEMGKEEANKGEDGGVDKDVSQAEKEENGERRDMFIISMKKTSISVVKGRGCDANSSCEGCHGTECSINDVVIVSESSKVTLVPRGGSNFRQAKLSNGSIEHVATHQYLRGLCSQETLYASPNPEKITIYYYKSTIVEMPHRGVPVVLNFTDSNCFLKCCKEGERVILRVQTCENRRLKHISTNDESKLSFVFYMKTDHSKQTKFESALHSGWFIQIVNTESEVKMETTDGTMEDHTFLFVINT